MPAVVVRGDLFDEAPDFVLGAGFGAQFPVGMLEHDGVEALHHLERHEIAMGHGVGGQMRQVAVSAGFHLRRIGRAENLAADPPVVAMLQVMGELFAQGDVGGDTAIEKIERMGRQQGLHGQRQDLQATQQVGAQRQVDADAPGQGLGRQGEQYNQQQQRQQPDFAVTR